MILSLIYYETDSCKHRVPFKVIDYIFLLTMFTIFQSDRVAAGLRGLGLENGDRIGIWGPNSYEWVLTQFAAAKAGLILVSDTDT